jgi:opacity protein-like surface antigen
MPDRRGRRGARNAFSLAVLGLGTLLYSAAPALAQPGSAPQPIGTRDFLFGYPRAWLAIRGSWLMPQAEGDLFAFVKDQLTVENGDFNAPAFISEVGFVLTSRIDASAGIEFSRGSTASEYRRFVDNLGAPITQSSELMQTNIAGGVKFALLDRGRAISRYAFVPRTVSPYVGAGGGMLYYKFQQTGDFVDFVTLRVFSDRFHSEGWTPSAHVFGGTEVRVWRSLFVDVEGRYVWASGELDSDFVGFDGIDLNGFRLSSGINVVF